MLGRRGFDPDSDAGSRVPEILADVRRHGDAAVRRWTQTLDGATVASTSVQAGQMRDAWDGLDHELCEALAVTARVLRRFQHLQMDHGARGDDAAQMTATPLQRVGCYVPGGRAAYPSSVLMCVIPAQVAGVSSIAVVSPPNVHGRAHPLVLAACHLLGVEEVHAVGGAQAIAALAYGTETIPKVDKIVGPGNVHVSTAKRMVMGTVDIDQVAGPSEIVVIASSGADPRFVSADLISQLEHDPLAWAVLLSDDERLISAVQAQFADDAAAAERTGIIAQAAGEHGMAVCCGSLAEAVSLAADFAPEHLSLQGEDAELLCDTVQNAGAVFVGSFSPVSLGDYIAGPNHTLPTQGAARYRGPLSVRDFLRWPSLVSMTPERFATLAPVAAVLARAEGLTGHERALALRLQALHVAEDSG